MKKLTGEEASILMLLAEFRDVTVEKALSFLPNPSDFVKQVAYAIKNPNNVYSKEINAEAEAFRYKAFPRNK